MAAELRKTSVGCWVSRRKVVRISSRDNEIVADRNSRRSSKIEKNTLIGTDTFKMPLAPVAHRKMTTIYLFCLVTYLALINVISINLVEANKLPANDQVKSSNLPKVSTSSLFDNEDTKLALATNEAATDMMLKSIIGGPILNSQFVRELDGAESSAQYGARGLPQIDRAAAHELAALQEQLQSQTVGELLDGSDARNPPVYKSAPKQISDVSHVVDSGAVAAAAAAADSAQTNGGQTGAVATNSASSDAVVGRSGREAMDLNRAAAGHYNKESSKHKKKVVKYKKKKSKKMKKSKKSKKIKKKKKKVVKKKKVKKSKKSKKSKKMKKKESKKSKKAVKIDTTYSGPSHHSEPNGDYFEYRAEPAKGAWDFGFKRGNPEHTVQRKEHGDKSHFKTEVKWQDKKGEGHHLFDYNHYNKKHGGGYDGHHAAAASKPKQQELPLAKEASELVGKENGQVKQQQLEQPQK